MLIVRPCQQQVPAQNLTVIVRLRHQLYGQGLLFVQMFAWLCWLLYVQLSHHQDWQSQLFSA